MNLDKKYMLLYAVTDRTWLGKRSLYAAVKEALENGVSCVQLREKELNKDDFLKEVKEISALCREYNVPFIVNDDIDIALACKADGIHIGQEDMELKRVRSLVGDKMIIGVSAHTVEEAKKAQEEGADYLGIGAVFSTSTKTDVNVLSLDTVRSICEAVDIPTVAIGGINKDNILTLKKSGIDGAAVVSAIFAAEDIAGATKELLKLAKEAFE